MKVAAIQLSAGDDKAKNIAKALYYVNEAIKNDAKLIVLPEVFNYRGALDRDIIRDVAERIPGESIKPLMALAKEHRVFILAGSIYEKASSRGKCYNTSVFINDYGRITARYRKTHLFEAVVNDRVIKETQYFLAGKTSAMATVDFSKLGLSVCYDVRFPELYRGYARRGCDIVSVPAVFTYQTGEAHWEVLLRARAIENLMYVVAANQCGTSPSGVRAFGNSLIIDPWGGIMARASTDQEEIIFAKVQREALEYSRAILPAVLKFKR